MNLQYYLYIHYGTIFNLSIFGINLFNFVIILKLLVMNSCLKPSILIHLVAKQKNVLQQFVYMLSYLTEFFHY